MEGNTNINQNTRPSRKGELNPMYGRTHSLESRNKMSASHKAYQQSLRNNQSNDNQNRNYVMRPMTMQQFLSNNPTVEDYLKELSKKVVQEEIDKLIRNSQRRISIPL